LDFVQTVQNGTGRLSRSALLLALLVQSLLLFHNLDLLSNWTDETFTLRTAPQPIARIPAILDADIHPPLYYFILHFWMELPFPGTLLARARALSVVWVLLATVALDRFWLRDLSRSGRIRFLTLWTLSPCLLLYGRMARSYSMQLFVGCLAVYAASRMLEAPASRLWIALYAAAGALLLYTHYVPGLAIPAAVCGIAAYRSLRARRVDLIRPVLISHLVMLVAYLPWLSSAARALSNWGARRGVYMATGSLLVEEVLKLGQWTITFSFGETFPKWGMWLAVLLVPALLAVSWGAWRPIDTWVSMAMCAAVIGYLGASRWVTFPFIPARLLFLYPFFLLLLTRALDTSRRIEWRNWVFGALLVLWAGGAWAYFHREGFLNKGYNLPLDQMATLINQGAARDDLIILDGCNSDAVSFIGYIRHPERVSYVSDAASAGLAWEASRRSRTIWYWRNTHDVCPGEANRHLEAELGSGFEANRHLYLPYSWLERRFIKLTGWPEQPTHFYQILEMRKKGA
jgi:hypothetical protein